MELLKGHEKAHRQTCDMCVFLDAQTKLPQSQISQQCPHRPDCTEISAPCSEAHSAAPGRCHPKTREPQRRPKRACSGGFSPMLHLFKYVSKIRRSVPIPNPKSMGEKRWKKDHLGHPCGRTPSPCGQLPPSEDPQSTDWHPWHLQISSSSLSMPTNGSAHSCEPKKQWP